MEQTGPFGMSRMVLIRMNTALLRRPRVEHNGVHHDGGAAATKDDERKDDLFWIILACTAALIYAFYYIAFAYADSSTSPDAITSVSLIFLVFEGGFIAAMPFVLFVFGYVQIFDLEEVRVTGLKSIYDDVCAMPYPEFLSSAVLGALIDVGYLCYLYASAQTGVVPSALATALMMSNIVIAALLSLFVFNEHKPFDLISIKSALITFGVIIYGVSIFLLVAYAYTG
jgi:hypothetical protein